jgi:hypothetical protein
MLTELDKVFSNATEEETKDIIITLNSKAHYEITIPYKEGWLEAIKSECYELYYTIFSLVKNVKGEENQYKFIWLICYWADRYNSELMPPLMAQFLDLHVSEIHSLIDIKTKAKNLVGRTTNFINAPYTSFLSLLNGYIKKVNFTKHLNTLKTKRDEIWANCTKFFKGILDRVAKEVTPEMIVSKSVELPEFLRMNYRNIANSVAKNIDKTHNDIAIKILPFIKEKATEALNYFIQNDKTFNESESLQLKIFFDKSVLLKIKREFRNLPLTDEEEFYKDALFS